MRKRVAVIVFAVAAAAVAEPALAIPAFARRYQVGCFHCHDGFPKLSAFGQRFKERGFRMEQEDPFSASSWIRTVPVVVRALARRDFVEDGDGVSSGFLKGISAGNLGKRLSYWVDDALAITEGSDTFIHAEPNNAWARFEVIEGGKLYARAGRMELDIPFTQVRTPHLFPYEIYAAGSQSSPENIGEYQEGVEVGGGLRNDLRWSVAVVRSRAVGALEASGANAFLRARKRIDDHRFGAFAYVGRNSRRFEVQGPEVQRDILRIGGDASVWWRRLNLYGLYLYGSTDDSGNTVSFNGGFLQGDYHASDWIALTLRGNILNPPVGPAGDRDTIASLFPGVQVWILRRLKLSGEYGFQNGGRQGFGAVQAEIAF